MRTGIDVIGWNGLTLSRDEVNVDLDALKYDCVPGKYIEILLTSHAMLYENIVLLMYDWMIHSLKP